MKKSFRRYANQVIAKIPADKKTKYRIREDILEMLEERSSSQQEELPEEILGKVDVLATEFCENLELSGPINAEYRSTIEVMGIPLVHITKSQFVPAKGIIAIGPSAIGIISIGGAAVGVISIGGVSVGVISLGGLTVALLLAIGGLAVSMNVAFGGLAVATSLAIGGYATAREVAIGGMVSAKLMLFTQSYDAPKELAQGIYKAYRNPDDIELFTKTVRELYDSMNFISRSFLKMIFG